MSLLKSRLCLLIEMALDFGYLLLKMSEAVGYFLAKSLCCPSRRLKFTSSTDLGGSRLSVTSPSPLTSHAVPTYRHMCIYMNENKING